MKARIQDHRDIKPDYRRDIPAGMAIGGYTMIELLITISIVAILAGLAVPAMTRFVQNDVLASQMNALAGSLALARSLAITRHQSVILCASADQATCSSSDWSDGWIVFVDANSDLNVSSNESIESQVAALEGNNTLSFSAGGRVIYDARGFAPNSAGTFVLCDSRGDDSIRTMTIQRSGRASSGGSGSC